MGQPMDRSRRIFAPVNATFEEVYPTLEEVKIEYTVSEFGQEIGKRFWDFKQQSGLIPCPNQSCQRGGFELDRIVSEMVRNHKSEGDFDKSCPGDEGSLKRRGRDCLYSIQGTIKLKYKT